VDRVSYSYLRLSLVRAPTSPDPETDQGHHDIDFAIIPHKGQLAASQVQTEALKFNNRPHGTFEGYRSGKNDELIAYVVVSGKLAPIPSFKICGPDAKAIQLETIKRGEDDKGDGVHTIILRMHESYGGRAKGMLQM
jgi:alpha-mannosidase